ncbi:helix-turn-helix domain-containing protein [Streptomyces sp. SID3343]|uniref:winged helix-turn-helix transcriptional regulator n=1 Tax=Streptomyces sp. SID3343 TaxID=2690260 RepID=UPI00136F027A|nr:helix-turn-helix domain-containing protein [Streptomyces sp. SID3343]MYW05871.1 transcriptional regulator [Streptomyces sp. SID3343]
MALGKDYGLQDCALARTLELVGERWTLLIVRDAFYGVRRYSDFLAHLDVPRAVLSARLQALVDAGVFVKHRYRQSPPRAEYVLTERGADLWPIIRSMATWGETHVQNGVPCRLYRHVDCGGTVDPSGSCAVCAALVGPRDTVVAPGPGANLLLRDDAVTRAMRTPHRLLEPLLP